MFTISPEEWKKFDEWVKTKDLKSYTGAIGGRWTYSFTPTNLGTIVKVKDQLLGDEIDITDYSDW